MLFNSYLFIFAFLPMVMGIFYIINLLKLNDISKIWIIFSSIFFYSWWNPSFLPLILFSIAFNYLVGSLLIGELQRTIKLAKKTILIIGITVNLSLLFYFKYYDFFLENLNDAFELDIELTGLILPLAISFFTFQQIAYLVDAYMGKIKDQNILNFSLFVCFFPQLIAGPIVHYRDIVKQFKFTDANRNYINYFTIGLTIFILGLFKKVIIADGLSVYANPVFDAAEIGTPLTLFEAWGGALAYSFQLYFDFSGYSDMAIGLARMFGVRLPVNFNSPYKATSLIDFWRRWHITLSQFLRDYIYIPLGGNRKSRFKSYLNILITMVLGGVWHGAGWTFLFWGFLHGFLLILNHVFRIFFPLITLKFYKAWFLTFGSVSILWVLFRAETLNGAIQMYKSMLGFYGVSLPQSFSSTLEGLQFFGVKFDGMFVNGAFDANGILWIFVSTVIALTMPNLQQFFGSDRSFSYFLNIPFARQLFHWKNSFPWSIFVSVCLVLAVMGIPNVTEFIYFRF